MYEQLLKKHDSTSYDEEYQLIKAKYDSVLGEYGTHTTITLEKLQKVHEDLKKSDDEYEVELYELRVK